MRSHNIIVQDDFSNHFRFCLQHEAPTRVPIEAEDFQDDFYTRQFVSRLSVDHAGWLRILSLADGTSANRLSTIHDCWDAITALLRRGMVKVYRLTHLKGYDGQQGEKKHYPIIDSTQGLQYHFVPTTVLLVHEPSDTRFFKNDPEQAKQFIQQLTQQQALNEKQLVSILDAIVLKWPIGGTQHPQRIAALTRAMVSGEVAVVTERTRMTVPTSSPASSNNALPVETITPKPATLGPHEEPGYVPKENPHSGLHNQAALTPDFKTSVDSFKTTRPVDMRNLSLEDKTARKALKGQGWSKKKVKQVLKSGDNFTETPYQAGDKLYGFNTAGRARNLDNSAYLLDEAGMKEVKEKYFTQGHWDKEGVKDYLALPCFNSASTIDAIEVTKPTTGIQSTIGKATELLRYDGADGYTTGTLGKIMGGGGRQATLDPSALKLFGK
ncbi:MAG: hypothetical protein COB30_020675 [Ectothiorhodospiraceae bacterium]|nr:hypothetical protein [Ectothiorhodospiraceae bacterium]